MKMKKLLVITLAVACASAQAVTIRDIEQSQNRREAFKKLYAYTLEKLVQFTPTCFIESNGVKMDLDRLGTDMLLLVKTHRDQNVDWEPTTVDIDLATNKISQGKEHCFISDRDTMKHLIAFSYALRSADAVS